MLLPIDVHFISVVSNGIRFSDQGIDIGMPQGTPIVAVADGIIAYAGPSPDSAAPGSTYRVLIRLDEPVLFRGRAYCWASYENLRRLNVERRPNDERRIAVKAGQQLGRSGVNRGLPYLNFSLLTDNDGSADLPMSGEDLQVFLWREVAQAQLGFSAAG